MRRLTENPDKASKVFPSNAIEKYEHIYPSPIPY